MFFGTNTEAPTMALRLTAPMNARDVPKRILCDVLDCGLLTYYGYAVTTRTYAPSTDFERWALLVFCGIWLATTAQNVA